MALESGDRYLAGLLCAGLAMLLTAGSEHDAAVRRAEQAYALASDLGNPSLSTIAEDSLGFALAPVDPDAAIRHLTAGLHASSALDGARLATGDTGRRCLARLLAGRGEIAAALDAYAGCLDRAMEAGAWFGLTLACDSLAVDLVAAGRHEIAAVMFGALEAPMVGYGGNPHIRREAALATVKEALGVQRFEESARRGRAMDLEDLGVFARAEVGRLLAEAQP